MAKPVGKLRKINLSEVWANEVDGCLLHGFSRKKF